MNYTEAVTYIEQIPRFAIKEPLAHAKELLRRVGDPQNTMKVIHVAGTNGKGSVCAYLASMLQEGGLSCGLFTSPHLVSMNERFRVNGEMMDNASFVRLFGRVKQVIDEFVAEGREHPSYFEILFAVGMLYFQEKQVEYAVLETGLGGRLDATNTVSHPLACIITSISLDHTEYLGDTVDKIAAEKAGIIKPGVPVIFDGCNPDAAAVIKRRADELGSPAFMLEESMYKAISNTPEGIRFLFDGADELAIPYVAAYQMMNASLAYFTMKVLSNVHGLKDEVLRRGIAGTRWEGRMETILPGVIVDGAHNEDGVRRFVETAVHFKKDYKITILFSAVADKRYREMIAEICRQIQPDAVVAAQIEGERSVPAGALAEEFRKNGCRKVHEQPDIGKAFDEACTMRGDGLLFCVGSLYLVGEIKKCLRRYENDKL
ncbi:bifunctional folylpolyglutamate synthase/dihydrofolate synthase [Ruminococcus sp. OA3]|uniref:bifunctional folylpolyglutamate synthase/dihydrofolate synthase n=1 Tax=Ruminococcus sp. OA3 TaxID=2914164 RepID=UPI001F0620FD|nr:folylpolyglutamate synthase/dihydrofolate synthase family protein [Ruminococcus sp. OA3]MCH1984287.1 bifunctional folylpolyglutamate synthase/dihydrofolate synthase [Ruminococcus sp. OA3]